MSSTIRTFAPVLAPPALGLFLLWMSGSEAGPAAWTLVGFVLAVLLAAILIPAIGDIIDARREMISWSGIAITAVALISPFLWFQDSGDASILAETDWELRALWIMTAALLLGICLAILPSSVAAWRRVTAEGAFASRQVLSGLSLAVRLTAVIATAWYLATRLDEPWPSHDSGSEQPAPSGSYFPPSQSQSFVACRPPSGQDVDRFNLKMLPWTEENLRAAREPSLYRQSVQPSAGDPASSYRFTWLRSFHPPMTVRIDESGGKLVLTAKRLSGDGGHRSNKRIGRMVRRELTRAESEKVRSLLNAARTVRSECEMYFDGAEWVAETRIGKSYHYAIQQSPETGPVREFGLYLLGLTGLRLDPVY